MRVLIKGVGDLTSEIALRLHRCGPDLVMTDIAAPTAVRRTVASLPAVHKGTTVVKDTTRVLCQNQEETQEAARAGRIVVVVDDRGDIRNTWKSKVIMDVIIVKKNSGTAIGDIQTVTGVGLGFTAGADCHYVVEIERGHSLGWCTWDGGVASNTGVLGIVSGYDREWIIWVSAGGIFIGCVSIEDLVERRQLVGRTGETPIYAEVGGMVRGLLQDGTAVCKGMKFDDAGPRGMMESCSTVFDKASTIGGGVLEAILSHTKLM